MNFMRAAYFTVILTVGLALPACHGSAGHGHGHGHEHGHDDEGPEPVALTLWTETHELFVEFDPLVAGQASSYHAHVTRLKDNHAAEKGAFSVVFTQGKTAARVQADRVARQGIFTPKGASPAPGTYQLAFVYRAASEEARWEVGPVKLERGAPAKLPTQEEGSITFLKETQWRMDFSTELPRTNKMARALTVPAIIEPDPRHTRTVLSPATGAVFWASESGVSVIGMKVARGQILGRVMPAASPDHWSTLQLQIQRARIERERAKKTLDRIGGLARQGLVASRRVVESQAAVDRAEATLKAAQLKVGQLRGRGGVALPLVAPADGILVEMHVTNGHKATAGEVLGHVAPPEHLHVRAEVFSLDLPRLKTIQWARLAIAASGVSFALDGTNSKLLTERIVLDPDTFAAPVIYRLQDDKSRINVGDLAELTLGVGGSRQYLTVPRSAVVEINTRPYLFVMKTGESFDRRLVRLGPSDGSRVAVVAGVTASERVVTVGAFDVYAASLAGSVESHRH